MSEDSYGTGCVGIGGGVTRRTWSLYVNNVIQLDITMGP